MSRDPPDERNNLKIDLLETLLVKEIYGPDSVAIDTVLDWFSLSEQTLAMDLIEEMHSNEDCPLKYKIGDHSRIWLRDKEETLEFIKDLQEDDAWFEEY